MGEFLEVISDIYRLKIPFDNIYTSVFLVKTSSKPILVDCGTTAFDVDEYLIPALGALGFKLCDVSKLIITHNHSDHAGGLSRLLEIFPDLTVISGISEVDKDILLYPLPGHTRDFIGVFDLRTGTLISGDGLQGAGVDKYRCSLASAESYLNTLEKIKEDDKVKNILFSHAYEPWNCDCIYGRESVLECIDECKKYVGDKQ